MRTLASRALGRASIALAALAGALAVVALGAADARATSTRSVHLRVEGRDGTLEAGRGYVAGTVRTRRAVGADPNCANRQGRPRFTGITPIGALGLAAQRNRRLDPLRMRLTDFGWQLCQVGSGAREKSFGTEAGDFGGWLYRINHEPGFAAMNEATLRAGDELLVHYAVFPAPGSEVEPLNNGRELALRGVPTRVVPGEPFTVRVAAFDEAGSQQPVGGSESVEVRGAAAPVAPGPDGSAELTVAEPGTARLRAVQSEPVDGAFGPELDIPSERVEVCARHNPKRCPGARGTLIRGSKRADRIRATRGDDVIRTGRGRDVVDLRPGGRNRVVCGPGRDRVIVNRGERGRQTLRGCERIVRR